MQYIAFKAINVKNNLVIALTQGTAMLPLCTKLRQIH